mmetsp:Transcript_39689/g.127176  ORF Transcript_39689/g.127176 Transcript_39689/m.127176 type:complete len:204 (-) Transcript_39689:108-719(-)
MSSSSPASRACWRAVSSAPSIASACTWLARNAICSAGRLRCVRGLHRLRPALRGAVGSRRQSSNLGATQPASRVPVCWRPTTTSPGWPATCPGPKSWFGTSLPPSTSSSWSRTRGASTGGCGGQAIRAGAWLPSGFRSPSPRPVAAGASPAAPPARSPRPPPPPGASPCSSAGNRPRPPALAMVPGRSSCPRRWPAGCFRRRC